MKSHTVPQDAGFAGTILPPGRRKARTEQPLPPEVARRKTATRRAIEEYHDNRALQRELEM
ncbi:PA3496 family putative envelope integrity protein [Aeromonas veronii]